MNKYYLYHNDLYRVGRLGVHKWTNNIYNEYYWVHKGKLGNGILTQFNFDNRAKELSEEEALVLMELRK